MNRKEHIQHLRGYTPPGGLTAKPEWYLRKEKTADKDPALANAPKKPYFVKPFSAADFTEGASILWLRFVRDFPNPWRIAYPLTLKNGDGLLPGGLYKGGGDSPATGTRWDYSQDRGGGWIKRTGDIVDQDNRSHKVEEWLRWMHEATVAEVNTT